MFVRLLVERAVRAAIASIAGFLALAAQSATVSATGLKTVAVGAVAAGVSAILSTVSQVFGDPESTSFTSVQIKR